MAATKPLAMERLRRGCLGFIVAGTARWEFDMARWRGGSTRWVVPVALTAFLAIAWLARSFELDTGELLDFLLTSAAFVIGLAVLAALAAGVLRLLRRVRGDR